MRDGNLALSTGLYRPIIWYKRPAAYALLALLAAIGTIGVALLRQTYATPMFQGRSNPASHQDNSA